MEVSSSSLFPPSFFTYPAFEQKTNEEIAVVNDGVWCGGEDTPYRQQVDELIRAYEHRFFSGADVAPSMKLADSNIKEFISWLQVCSAIRKDEESSLFAQGGHDLVKPADEIRSKKMDYSSSQIISEVSGFLILNVP